MKTARSDVHHKTEVDGVRLGLDGETALTRAYEDLSSRLDLSHAYRVVHITAGLMTDFGFGRPKGIHLVGINVNGMGDQRLWP